MFERPTCHDILCICIHVCICIYTLIYVYITSFERPLSHVGKIFNSHSHTFINVATFWTVIINTMRRTSITCLHASYLQQSLTYVYKRWNVLDCSYQHKFVEQAPHACTHAYESENIYKYIHGYARSPSNMYGHGHAHVKYVKLAPCSYENLPRSCEQCVFTY